MAKVKINGFKNIQRNIQMGLLRSIRDQGVLNLIARDIIGDVRNGTDPLTGRAYPKKSKLWTSRQRNLIRVAGNRPDKFWSPRKSNLTFTGQLVKSVKATVQVSKSLIIIEPSGVHKAYKSPQGAFNAIKFNKKTGAYKRGKLRRLDAKGKSRTLKNLGGNVRNKDLAQFLADAKKPRNLIGISKDRADKTIRLLRTTLKKYLKTQ